MSREKISVILCAYTEARWDALQAAVASVEQQSLRPHEIIVVVDHNQALLEKAQHTFSGSVVTANTGPRGLSGARNSGVALAEGDIVAFLDDDAAAERDWLEQLVTGYHSDPQAQVLGVGGAAFPLWPSHKPRWFPDEFLWVVGCSHLGTPQTTLPVRNFIGCNMSFRRAALESVGEFRNDVGRVGSYPAGCEETELCIRMTQRLPGTLLYNPDARVLHHVSEPRTTLGYFVSRCYAEGVSKARVIGRVGRRDGLATERAYTLRTLPRGIRRGVADTFVGRNGVGPNSARDPMGIARAASIALGLGVTAAGYVAGRVNSLTAGQTLPDFQQRLDETGRETTFRPTQVLEVDISKPLPTLSPQPSQSYAKASILVRVCGKPVGMLEVDLNSEVSAAVLATLIWNALGAAIKAQFAPETQARLTLTAEGLSQAPLSEQTKLGYPADAPLTLVSVIIATHNRTQSLATCLDSLAELDYPHYEVVVVDNAPSNAETFALLQRDYPAVRYVRENIPGLAVAHNRGLAEARGDIVAFTDDDVRVDAQWLSALVAGFNASSHNLDGEVGCVTGMIVPAELETPAQVWLEQYGGFNKGFELSVFDLHRHRPESPLYPYTAGVFGSGANMAFKRKVLLELGGFDPALGAGSKGVGGDDLAAFFDVVSLGYALVYQPEALVFHWHRRDYAGLQRQAYGYGVGLTAFLTKSILDKPKRLLDILPLIPQAVFYALSPTSPKNAKKRSDYPKELNRLERKGMLYGPLAYLRSRRHYKLRHSKLCHTRAARRAGSSLKGTP